MSKARRKKGSSRSASMAGSGVPSLELTEVIGELDAIKRLLTLLLAKMGSKSAEIAMALGVGESTVRTELSFRRIERLPFVGPSREES